MEVQQYWELIICRHTRGSRARKYNQIRHTENLIFELVNWHNCGQHIVDEFHRLPFVHNITTGISMEGLFVFV